MKPPETPLAELPRDADLPTVTAKLNEVIRCINSMWLAELEENA